jgi:hypothetical protein
VSTILSGSWRSTVSDSGLGEDELAAILPLLIGSGAGALAWPRIAGRPLASTLAGTRLHEEHRYQTLRAAVRERDLATALTALCDEDIDAILIKGWSVARLYSDPAARPHGDIDVCVRERHAPRAAALAARLVKDECFLDVHTLPSDLADRSLDQLFARSQQEMLSHVNIRVLAPEDQLALLSLHFLRHGAWRPLWLCDVAAAVETRPDGFDWGLCLGSNARRAGWILASLGLAHELLGADLTGTPAATPNRGGRRPPHWLVHAVVRAWQTPYPDLQPPIRHHVPLSEERRNPAVLLRALRARWPNPIEASIEVGAPCNRVPRLPYQLQCALRRTRFWLSRA